MAAGRSQFPVRLGLNPRGIGLRHIARMAGWTLLYVLAAQVLFTVVSRLANSAGTGAVASYQNAYTLFQLPYAVIALTVITGALPRMSRAAANRDLSQLTSNLSQSLRLTAVVLAPVAAGLVTLAPQIVTVLFDHGNATPAAVALTGHTLAAFGLALVPFAGYQTLLRVFYVLQDTKSPALIHTVVVAVAITMLLVMSSVLPRRDLVIGLAACYAIAYTLGCLITALVLRRRIGRIDGHRLVDSYSRILLAALTAGLAGTGTVYALCPTLGTDWTASLVAMTTAAALAAGVYALAAHRLHITEFRTLLAALRPARTG